MLIVGYYYVSVFLVLLIFEIKFKYLYLIWAKFVVKIKLFQNIDSMFK